MTSRLEGTVDSIAHGGQGVVRVDGKVHFVPDALPGSEVVFDVTEDHARWARGRLVEVVSPGPYTSSPVCQHAGICGGCQWQHADLAAQREWKRTVVVEQLSRIGKVEDPPVLQARSVGTPFGYRNRMDFAVDAGGLALHRRRSDDLVSVVECPILHPSLELLVEIEVPGSTRVTIRSGIRTGERLVVIDGAAPSAAGEWGVPVCRVERGTITPLIGDPWLHEVVAGMRFRVSGDAFFQNNTDGADMLAEVVAGYAGRGGDLIDAYAGGGLFSCTIGRRFDRVLAVESGRLAKEDFRHNAAGLDHVELHEGKVERSAERVAGLKGATVIADPPRAGLGRPGVAALLSADPSKLVLVSCDPASLGRDAGLLADAGYQLVEATPLDLFPQTFHIEVVSLFEPERRRAYVAG